MRTAPHLRTRRLDKRWVEETVQVLKKSEHPNTELAVACYRLCAALEARYISETFLRTAFRRFYWTVHESNTRFGEKT